MLSSEQILSRVTRNNVGRNSGLATTKLIERDSLLPSQSTHYVVTSGFLSDGIPNTLDLLQPLPQPNHATQLALMIAFFAGVRDVVLVGCDHSWLDEPGESTPFVASQKSLRSPQGVDALGRSDYLDLVSSVYDLWAGYRHLQDYTTQRSMRVVNATRGGRLDVFERVELGSLK